jgi:alkanesulfonate monooxygenase SsuD/methylene tetrahydromethanopterin reductase-like flavin-dependent oxidoreductase (luciferase family)
VFDRTAKWGAGILLARSHVQPGQFEKRLAQLDARLAATKRTRDEIDLVVTNGLSLGKTHEAAIARFHNSILPARMDGIAARQGMTSRPSQDINQVLLYNLIGSPDQVIEQVHGLQKRHITHCVLYYNPVRNSQEMAEQIQCFGETVIPAFR